MKALVVLTKANQIFENSFLEAAAANGISLTMFYVDEGRNQPPSFWREQVKQVIREQAMEKLLMINDYSSGKEFLVDDSIFALVPCNVWFVDPLKLNAYATARHLSGYRHIFTYNLRTFRIAYRNLTSVRTIFRYLRGTLFFVLLPGILQKKKNTTFALSVLWARTREDYRYWKRRHGFAGSGIIPWPYTGNFGMTAGGWRRR